MRFIQSDTLTNRLTYVLLTALLFFTLESMAQGGIIRGAGGRLRQMGGRGSGNASAGDSLKRRDKNEDSITVRFRYLDSTRNYTLDSSIVDFANRYPVPPTSVYLGNTGTANHSLLFSPIMQPGWDPGFHSFDTYKWTIDKARFFNTTRPYSELTYQLGSRSEQIIEVMHTQNIKPNWNFLFQYRLINSPGFFKNQKANHNNYQLTSWYQSKNKRYNAYFILLANKLQVGENGGLQDTANFLDDPVYKDRFNIYTKLGGDPIYGTNFFSTETGTGNRSSDFTVLLRQQYDFGRKDSLVTDSSVVPLFYPRLRFEHTIQYGTRKYTYLDLPFSGISGNYFPDSAYYFDNYQLLIPNDSVYIRDEWKEMINDFSIYQFPDANNLQQFFKVGAAIQNLSLKNAKIGGTTRLYNIFGHAEYRNRTRNQKWEIEANGKLYFTGTNSADYYAYASLQRYVGKRKAYAQLGFENVNRKPSFIYDPRSSFFVAPAALPDIKKENTIHLFAALYEPAIRLKLSGDYYLATNYTYLRGFGDLQQESTVFNVLRISALKTIKLGKNWSWHADVYFQQVLGNAIPVNLPLVFTRNRIGYEGKLGFANLDIAFGAELRYHTPYKADGYSPLLGKFYYQDSQTVKNQVPHLAGYVHFRIKGFKLYFRAENLSTARDNNGFGFTNNIIETPGYPYPGLVIRMGIYWSFVN